MNHDSYRVETPERVDLAYDVAGLGSRFLAQLIDSTIQSVAIALLWLAVLLWGASTEDDESMTDLRALAFIGALLLSFVLLWGYHILFEMVWHGQTPGKRPLGLRVIKEGGYPVGFVDSVIRNVVRLVDFLPFFYVVGATAMFLDPRSRRLGDLAAGTLVVKERRDLRLESVTTGLSADDRPPGVGAPELARLSAADQSLLREYVRRRAALAAVAAGALAERVAVVLAPKLGREVGPDGPDAFLLALAAEIGWGETVARAAPLGAGSAAPRSLRRRLLTPVGVALLGVVALLVVLGLLAWPDAPAEDDATPPSTLAAPR
jgi:uncharacterized RDD family membrane protein YckC